MTIKLIDVKKKDSDFIFRLRNDPFVRKNSLSSEKIGIDDHRKWFSKTIKNKFKKFFIIHYGKKTCGYVRIEKKARPYVSICVDSMFRRKEIASSALLLVEKKFSNLNSLFAIVKKRNNASKFLFSKVGYEVIKKKNEFILMKKKINHLKIIDQIESIRGRNNVSWMNLLRLAYRKSPRESSKIIASIYKDDAKISKLVKKLIKK
jgi:hypothetical protein